MNVDYVIMCEMCHAHQTQHMGEYCPTCQKALEDGASWAIQADEDIQDENRQEKKELEHRAYDSSNVQQGIITNDDVLESIADANVINPFEAITAPRAALMEADALVHIGAICLALHQRGLKWYDTADPTNNKRHVVISAYAVAYWRYDVGDSKYPPEAENILALYINPYFEQHKLPTWKLKEYERELKKVKETLKRYGFHARLNGKD